MVILMANYIKVNVNELNDIKSKFELNGNELIELLNKIISNTELTKDCFDSLTGNLYRKELINYLNGRIEYIKNNYLTLASQLDLIIKEYTEFYDSVKMSVGGNK